MATTVKLTGTQVMGAHLRLERLGEEKRKLKGRLVIRFGRICRAFRLQWEEMEEGRQALLDRYVSTEDGTRIKEASGEFKMEDGNGFKKEWENILDEERELTFTPITEKQLGSAFELSPRDVDVLEECGVLVFDKEEEDDDDSEMPTD